MREKIDIDNIRKSMETLPSQKPEKSCEYHSAYDSRACTVKLVDVIKNPYRSLVRMATATWGNGELGYESGSCSKWEKLSPANRFLVVLGILTGNTLPTALECINLVWEFNGVPRHTFDQFARMRIGAGHASIGCRDNSKLDAPLILYPDLYERIHKDPALRRKFERWISDTKDLYEEILEGESGSYQTARAVLPMSYNHSWVSYTNLLAFKGQAGRRMMFCEEAPIVILFWKMFGEIKERWPLIANYIRPICDNAHKCVYSGGAEGLTKYFSSLFRGCGRWKDPHSYSEFNHSCTDEKEFRSIKALGHINPNEWKEYTELDYEKLSDKDRNLFEEN